MRAAAMIMGLATACTSGGGEEEVVERARDSGVQLRDTASDAPLSAPETPASLRDGLTMFFNMDESGDDLRFDHVSGVTLYAWQRTGDSSYELRGDGTTPVMGAVGDGQHIEGSIGYHFTTPSAPAMRHGGGSFTWAGWVSVDAVDADLPYLDDQTLVAKWNGLPDTFAPQDHREYRVWHDQALSRWRFEVSARGLQGVGDSQVVTHPTLVERGRLYFVEAWHDADGDTINLRVSTQRERGAVSSVAWSDVVFSGGADLNIGAQNTCTDDHLQGIIDALGHWRRVLTAEESAALWNDGAGLEL